MKALLPGLYLLPVPIPYPLKTVNLYLLQGAGEVALVDTALGTRAARGPWSSIWRSSASASRT